MKKSGQEAKKSHPKGEKKGAESKQDAEKGSRRKVLSRDGTANPRAGDMRDGEKKDGQNYGKTMGAMSGKMGSKPDPKPDLKSQAKGTSRVEPKTEPKVRPKPDKHTTGQSGPKTTPLDAGKMQGNIGSALSSNGEDSKVAKAGERKQVITVPVKTGGSKQSKHTCNVPSQWYSERFARSYR
jgi:hypothetical protein